MYAAVPIELIIENNLQKSITPFHRYFPDTLLIVS